MFDGYELERKIGAGAMGEVYLAHDALLDRQVAIKLISGACADSSARSRFMREARAIARLQHPNVVAIYRVGQTDDGPYLVSEYVRGESLDRIQKPLDGPTALKIGLEIACGLAATHRKGVIHRDIKPSNVILSESGTVKLLDFGIAKLLEPGEAAGGAASPGLASSVQQPLDPQAGVAELTQTLDVAPDGAASSHDLTAASSIVGTPIYMAPELWRGEPASFASDVYALGALLYTLCSGDPPHQADDMLTLSERIQTQDAPPLAGVTTGLDHELCRVVDRCLQRIPERRFASGNEVRAALAQLTPAARTGPLPTDTPYRGLSAFDSEHRGLFFGRDSEIRMILDRLVAEPFVLVAGDSGIGKSSLCRAGVMPRVDAWLGEGQQWVVVTVIPGKHPVRSLAAALAPLLNQGEHELAQAIESDPAGVARSLRAVRGNSGGILIFVDQLEELITLGSDEAASAAHLLGWLAEPAPGARLLASARGDYLSRLACLPRLGEEISRALYFLRPLSNERIREAITGPARIMGVAFESAELVEELVASTTSSRGGLPLLQFTLAELWQALGPGEKTIDRKTLESLGGVTGALTRHADQVLAQMLPAERVAAREVLLRLLTEDGTRARRSEAELCADDQRRRAALSALVRGRIVVARETAEGSGYEIAHETLTRSWSTLADWLADDADRQRLLLRLHAAAAEWKRIGRHRDALWSVRQVAEVTPLARGSLPAGERAFLAASRLTHRRALALRVLIIVAAPLLAVLVFGGVRLKADLDRRRRVEALTGTAARALDRARGHRGRSDALKRRALALFDRREQKAAERGWALFRARSAQARTAYHEASQRLETALLLDPRSPRLRDLFAAALYERAERAEQDHRYAERDELLQRLTLYDRVGDFQRRWATPAQVKLELSPPGATLNLQRYVADGRGRLHLRAISGARRAGARSLPAGSYLATVTAAGHPAVRLPFAVDRGERVTFTVVVPGAGQVPRGFVFVPPGRFLFGSAADDGQRRGFLHTVPAHVVRTPGYLIARHETTYADWLAYLMALPAAVRAERSPRIDKGGFQGALSLEALGSGGWQLSLKPASRLHVARSGQALVYPGRAHHARQRWIRFPVTGISAADAARYLRWLDRSGRVPGARFCTGLEWERAARGADGRVYPHGAALAPDEANFDDTYGKRPESLGPDEVGSHPASRSPFSLDDMAGNVWEWTRSSVGPGGHVARGGSFHFGSNSSRSAGREVTDPSFKDISVGLRVCADAPGTCAAAPGDDQLVPGFDRADGARRAESARKIGVASTRTLPTP